MYFHKLKVLKAINVFNINLILTLLRHPLLPVIRLLVIDILIKDQHTSHCCIFVLTIHIVTVPLLITQHKLSTPWNLVPFSVNRVAPDTLALIEQVRKAGNECKHINRLSVPAGLLLCQLHYVLPASCISLFLIVYTAIGNGMHEFMKDGHGQEIETDIHQ